VVKRPNLNPNNLSRQDPTSAKPDSVQRLSQTVTSTSFSVSRSEKKNKSPSDIIFKSHVENNQAKVKPRLTKNRGNSHTQEQGNIQNEKEALKTKFTASRRRAHLPQRKINNNPVLQISEKKFNSKKTVPTRIDQRLKSEFDPRRSDKKSKGTEHSTIASIKGIARKENVPTTKQIEHQPTVAEPTQKKKEVLTKENLNTNIVIPTIAPLFDNKNFARVKEDTVIKNPEDNTFGKIYQLRSNSVNKSTTMERNPETTPNDDKNKRYRFRLESRRDLNNTQETKISKNLNIIPSFITISEPLTRKINEPESSHSSKANIRRNKKDKKRVDHRIESRFDPQIKSRARSFKTELVDDNSDPNSTPKPIRTEELQQSSLTYPIQNIQKDANFSTQDDTTLMKSNKQKEEPVQETNVLEKLNQIQTDPNKKIKKSEKASKKYTFSSNTRKEANLLENKDGTEHVNPPSSRRGNLLQRKSNHKEISKVPTQTNIRSQRIEPRRITQRLKQSFDPRKRHNPKVEMNEDAVKPINLAKAKNNPSSTQKHSKTSSGEENPSEEYFDIAFKHAEVTWAQDPFRKVNGQVDGPSFDIDYSKDPNYNSNDNEGSAGKFSNFAKELKSSRTKSSENVNYGSNRYLFVPRKQRTRQRQTPRTHTDRTQLEDIEGVSIETVGSSSSTDPVLIPFFVPDLSRLEQSNKQPLFEPFSFSVNL